MKKTYKELIKENLKEGEWSEESKLLSVVVREKYGVARASTARMLGVKSQLKILLGTREIVKGITSEGKLFWTKGSNFKNNIVLISDDETIFSNSTAILVQVAQKNIKKIEVYLTELISDKLKSCYGEGWVNKIPPYTLEKLSKQYEKNTNNKWSHTKSNSILDTANIVDFVDILRSEWQIFKPIFGDKEITIGRLKEISIFRNSIQHNRELLDREYIYFNLSAQLFLEKFSQ